MFLISDFIDNSDYTTPLNISCNKHDVMAIQVYDRRDSKMPDVGLMRIADLELEATRWIRHLVVEDAQGIRQMVV